MAAHTIDFANTDSGPPHPSILEDTGQHTDAEKNNDTIAPNEIGPCLELESTPTANTAPPGTPHSHINTIRTTETTTGRADLPRLRHRETKLAQKEAHPWQHLGIALGLPMILLCDIIVPCIIYYAWWRPRHAAWAAQCRALDHHQQQPQPCPVPFPEQFNELILGVAVASFGIGELWIWVARVHRLWFQRDACAPLLSTGSKWALDATSWVYLVAMVMALIPFTLGSALVMPHLYLYGPSFLMGFVGIMMVITTLHPFKIPVAINSQPKGTLLRPLIYYAAEDFMAVDGLQDREFRTRYNERYEANPMFRRFFFNLTLWWTLGVCVYIGCVSAVIWTLPFHYAFGLSLGLLFSYIAIWAVVTFVWVKIEMKREHEAYERGDFDV